jgi:hypothetical protein
MRDLTTSQKFAYVVKHVLSTPFSLAILAVGGVVSYWLGSWIPMLFAGIGELGLIYNSLHNEDDLRKLFLERQEREETLTEQQIETLLERMDFETRQRIRYILQLQKEMAREARADDVESYSRQDLERIAGKLSPLVQQALRLAERKQKLSRYLQNVDERALKNYCNNVRQRIAATTDPVQQAQYEQALKAREAELQTYQAIAQASGRIDSQLENVEATFASWKAKVIRIKTADVNAAQSVSEGLYQELDSLSSEIDLLDNSVTEALAGDEQVELRPKI